MNEYPYQIRQAGETLLHYFEQAGVDTRGDSASEIHQIPEMIYDTALADARREIKAQQLLSGSDQS